MNIKATVVSARDVGFGMFLSRVALSVTASKLSVVLVWFFFISKKSSVVSKVPLVVSTQYSGCRNQTSIVLVTDVWHQHVSTRLVLNAGLGLDHVVS